MTKVENFGRKKILLVGLGREGESSLQFLRSRFAQLEIGLADQKPVDQLSLSLQNIIKQDSHLKIYCGKKFLNSPEDYNLIIRSPGVPLNLPLLQKAKKRGVEITSQTKIFFDNTKSKIIGITGTKGKSTTSSLIYHVLKTGQFKVNLVGNVGSPVLSSFPQGLSLGEADSFYVYELSSHQLVDLNKSPNIAVFLNLYPDHLDYFSNLEEYRKSKLNLIRYQTKQDYLIYNLDDTWLVKETQKSVAQKLPFSLAEVEDAFGFIARGWICYRDKQKRGETEKIIPLEEVPLVGKFNLQNILPAVIVARHLGMTADNIRQAIKTFRSLQHRLTKVGIFRGIRFYDDSNATIPDATIRALESLGPEIDVLILGGSNKNLDFDDLASKILETGIGTLILFPTTGAKIWAAVSRKFLEGESKNKLPQHFSAQSMEEAVRLSYQWTRKGKICLLSPASASFSLFRNYKERGELFQKWVKQLAL